MGLTTARPCVCRFKPSDLPADVERAIYDISIRMRAEPGNTLVVSLIQELHHCHCMWL